MLTRYACTFSIILLGFLAISSVPRVPQGLTIEPSEIQLDKPLQRLVFQPQDRSAEYMLIKGIIISKIKEGVWYQCGVRLPETIWYDKAVEIAEACVYSARPLGVDPMGQLATWQHESRLDPCAIGPYPRKWAIKRKLLRAKRGSLSYTKAEVKAVLADPRFKASFPVMDLGLAQLLYPLYTRDATVDEILSVDGAIYSAKELAYRGKMWKTDEPWIYWPGHKSRSRANEIHWWVYTVMEQEF